MYDSLSLSIILNRKQISFDIEQDFFNPVWGMSIRNLN